MAKVIINVTSVDGELLEQVTVVDGAKTVVELAVAVIDRVGFAFEIEEDASWPK